MKKFRTTTAVLASAALVGGAAAPAFAQSGDYPSEPSGSTQAQRPAKKGKRGPKKLTDGQLTTVATKLGTTLEALKAAQAKVKAAVAATDATETKAERDALLAAELNVTVAQLKAAFDSVRGTTDGTCKAKGSSGSTGGQYPTDSSTTSTAS